jgi:3-oxoacyl-[acyl-carrier-protein] synthase II
MVAALEDAGIMRNEVDHINLHATSTPIGDRSEIQAVKSLFGDQRLWLSACKGGTGHLLGASGAVEAVHCILCLQENMIPPAISSGILDHTIPSGYELVREKPQPWTSNYILSNNFGFGGHNAVIVFKKLF